MKYLRYNYRIYPTKYAKNYIEHQIKGARMYYNYLVDCFNQGIEPFSRAEIKRTKEYQYLSSCLDDVLSNTERDFKQAKNRFFKGISNRPKFKSCKDEQSIRFSNRDNYPTEIYSLKEEPTKNSYRIKITYMKQYPMKIFYHRPIIGTIKSTTVMRKSDNKYYVSILCALDDNQYKSISNKLPQTYKSVGIDVGIKDLLITSDGKKFKNPKYYESYLDKLKFLQRKLSKYRELLKKDRTSTKLNKKYNYFKLKVARLHKKIYHKRQDYINKLSFFLVKHYSHISCETLNIRSLLKNRNISKKILDASWGGLILKIKYKSELYNRTFTKVSRLFPSTQLCNICLYRNIKLRNNVSIRTWRCPICNTKLDRDINSAKNIRDYEEIINRCPSHLRYNRLERKYSILLNLVNQPLV